MGYVEKVMGDAERVVYRTHKHAIVLLQKIISPLLTFALLLALGVAAFVPADTESGGNIRFIIYLVGLGSLVVPLVMVVRAWIGDFRRGDLVKEIWRPVAVGIAALTLSLIVLLQPEWENIAGGIGIGLSLVPLALVIRRFLEWLNERYIITNRRVMEVKGIINKHVRDSVLEKVNDVDLNQSFAGRILRYGTVQIITGSDIGLNRFRRISNPVKFKRAMLNAKEEIHVATSVPLGMRAPIEPEILIEEIEEIESVPPLWVQPEAASTPAPEGLIPDDLLEVEDEAPASPPGPPAPAVELEPDRRADSSIPDLIRELDELRQKGILTADEFQAKKQELLGRL